MSIPIHIILQCWKDVLLINYQVLSKSISLILFDKTFPREILHFINLLNVQLIKEEIESNQKIICPCQDNKCQLGWYSKVKRKISEDYLNRPPFRNIFHCNVLQKNGLKCHNIFFYYPIGIKMIQCDGFVCEGLRCNENRTGVLNLCCIKCLYPYSKSNDCIECARVRFNTDC